MDTGPDGRPRINQIAPVDSHDAAKDHVSRLHEWLEKLGVEEHELVAKAKAALIEFEEWIKRHVHSKTNSGNTVI